MPANTEWIGTTTASKVVDVNARTLLMWAEKGMMPGVRTRVLPTGRTQFNRVDLERFTAKLNGEGKVTHD